MKVSVLVMTYNHAGFIEQALDSVFTQEADFEVEVLISEDCSTDGTREIVLGYRRSYPDKVRLLLSEQNLCSNQIVARGIQAAQGQYVALLDGDDYWISPYKLQKQVAYLDSHPQCAICFHNAQVVHEDGGRATWNWTPGDQPEITDFEDLWLGNYIATSSTMYRRGLVGHIPAWYDAFFPITDWPLHLLHAEHGFLGYINEVLSVYRHHSGGYYSRLTQREKLASTLKFYHRMNASLNYQYDSLVKTAISKYFIEWAEEYLTRGDLKAARACYKTYLTGRPINKYISLRRMAAIAMRLYLPHRMRPGRWRAA